MRLIDADALLESMGAFFKKAEEGARYAGRRDTEVTWNDAVYMIKVAPTIKPDVTNCKDCKHFHQGEPYSMCYRTPYPYIVDGENDYCSFVDEGR